MELIRGVKLQIPRSTRRVDVDWPARSMIPAEQVWTDCRLIDLSLGGAALGVPIPADEPRGPLILELQDGDGQPRGLQLRGEVSNWEPRNGSLRVGIVFVNMSILERYKLAGLLSRERRGRKA